MDSHDQYAKTDEHAQSHKTTRVTSDTQDFANVVTLTLNLMSQLLLVVIIFAILFSINPRLALIAASIAPFVIAAALALVVPKVWDRPTGVIP